MPRLVHLASDHAVHGDPLEDDLAREVYRDLARGDAEQLDAPSPAHGGEGLMQGRGDARHLAHHVRPLAPGLGEHGAYTSSRAALRVRWAPILAASASRVGLTSEAITLAAPAARAIPTAKQPIGPQPTTNTVLPGISAESTA